MTYQGSSPAGGPGVSAGSPPSSVRTAALLVYALVALMAIRTLLTILFKDDLIEAYATDRNINVTLAEDGAPAYTAIAIGSLIIFGGLLLLCAVYFSKGANWARIVATVFAALSVIGSLLVFVQPAPTWYKLLGILSGLIALGIIVMLYRPDANQFFRAAKQGNQPVEPSYPPQQPGTY